MVERRTRVRSRHPRRYSAGALAVCAKFGVEGRPFSHGIVRASGLSRPTIYAHFNHRSKTHPRAVETPPSAQGAHAAGGQRRSPGDAMASSSSRSRDFRRSGRRARRGLMLSGAAAMARYRQLPSHHPHTPRKKHKIYGPLMAVRSMRASVPTTSRTLVRFLSRCELQLRENA